MQTDIRNICSPTSKLGMQGTGLIRACLRALKGRMMIYVRGCLVKLVYKRNPPYD